MPTPSANYDLPGVSVDIADLGLRIAAPVPGPKLTLIGQTSADLTGTDLSVNEPFLIQSIPVAVNTFKNRDGSDSELSKAIEKAAAAGARDIEAIITDSTEAGYADEDARWDSLAATYRAIKSHPLDIIVTDEAYIDAVGLSGTDQYSETRTDFRRQLQDFCYRATKIGNTTRGVIGLRPLLATANLEDWTDAATSEHQELFNTPSLAEMNEWQNHVEASNGTLNDHSAETELVGYINGSIEGQPGVISPSYDGWAKEEDGSTATDHIGNNVDGGRAVTVFGAICRQVLDSTRTRAAKLGRAGEVSENTNGAVAYAAMLTTLNPGESPTNRPIPSVVPARNVPDTLATALLNARIATMVNRTAGFVVSKGITAAYNAANFTRSDYVNYTTYDTVILAVDLSKNVVERYIGKQSAPEVINAMQNDLDNALHNLVRTGLAERVVASIIQTRDQQILGNLDIELDIVPYGEIQNVTFRALLHRE